MNLLIKVFTLMGIWSLSLTSVYGQAQRSERQLFQAELANPVVYERSAGLTGVLAEFEIVHLDIKGLSRHVQSQPANIQFDLQIGERAPLKIALELNELRAPHYRAIATTDYGEVELLRTPCETYKGLVNDDEKLFTRLTINKKAIIGYFKDGQEEWFIEPLSRILGTEVEGDYFVVYKIKDVLSDPNGYCGVTEMEERKSQIEHDHHHHEGTQKVNGGTCNYLLELATDADYEWFQTYGNDSNAEIITNLNLVEGVYQSTFNMNFSIVFQNVWETSSDPYTAAGSPSSIILDEIRAEWETNNATFMAVERDLMHLFSAKDHGGLLGSVSGGLPSVCSRPDKAHGFTVDRENAYLTTAHEIGHNLDGRHGDGENCDLDTRSIMCQGSNKNLYFSAASITRLDNYICDEGDCMIDDETAPSASCQNTTTQLNSSGVATISTGDIDNGSSDACGIESLSLSQTSFGCNEIGSNTVTLTVTDLGGNTATCNATVTVEDNIAPTAGCQNVTVQLNASGMGNTTAAAIESGSTDNCGTVNTESLSQTTFDCSELGANTVTLTINDGNGNTATCNATVTVEDNIAPTAGCQNVTVQLNASGMGNTTAAAIESGSTDNCGTVNIESLSQTTFDCSDLGANTVTLTVNDGNGNTATCNATVTVEDDIAPTVFCLTTTVEIQPDGMYTLQESDVFDNINSFDNCAITNVNFPATVYDCDDVDGTFTISVTASDEAGNSNSCTATITVAIGDALPDGWTTNDIGMVTVGNEYAFDPCTSANPEDGEFTIIGSGNNAFPGGSTDNVAFASQYLCGNVSITAKVESVTNNGYGGLMIRETTATGAKQVALFSNLTNILKHETRYTTNGMKQINHFYKPGSYWLRLERQGDWIFAYYSTTGMTFQYVHAVYVPMQNCVEVGLASYTYQVNQQTEAIFSFVSLSGGAASSSQNGSIEVEYSDKPVEIGVNIFPNPNKGSFNVRLGKAFEQDVQMIIYNHLGQQITTQILDAGTIQYEWSLENVPNGNYLLHFEGEGIETEVKPFIISK